jgi:hypothetical protein
MLFDLPRHGHSVRYRKGDWYLYVPHPRQAHLHRNGKGEPRGPPSMPRIGLRRDIGIIASPWRGTLALMREDPAFMSIGRVPP